MFFEKSINPYMNFNSIYKILEKTHWLIILMIYHNVIEINFIILSWRKWKYLKKYSIEFILNYRNLYWHVMIIIPSLQILSQPLPRSSPWKFYQSSWLTSLKMSFHPSPTSTVCRTPEPHHCPRLGSYHNIWLCSVDGRWWWLLSVWTLFWSSSGLSHLSSNRYLL